MQLYRIGLFTDMYFPQIGGVQASIYLLWRELNQIGHQAWVIAPDYPGAKGEEGVVRLSSVAYPLYPGQRLALIGKLPTRFEIIHSHTPLPVGFWAGSLAQSQQIPHVATFHGHLEYYAHYVPGLLTLNRYTRALRRFARSHYNRADLIIAPTEPIRQLAVEYGMEREIKVIPTGLDLEGLNRAPTPNSPWPQGKRRLLTVSRLGREKSTDVILRAVAALNSPQVHLVVVGEGPEREALQQLTAELGISEQVNFVGLVPYAEVGGYYRQAEVFLFASESETQGLVLGEAQACGVPVVAVGAAGTLSGLEEGCTGFLVPPKDHQGMAQRVKLLLENRELHHQMAQAAARWASHFSTAQMARKVVACYDDVTAQVRLEQQLGQPLRRYLRLD